ncbi:hypothetical protein ACVWXO_003492 [Bradyrhizobium sp. LM2.7]
MTGMRTLMACRGAAVPLSFGPVCAGASIALSIAGLVRAIVLFGAALAYTPLPCRIRTF